MADDGLDKYIDEILKAKDYSGVTAEVRQFIADDLKKNFIEQLNRAILTEMPDDKLDEFSDLLDKEGIDDSDVQKFVEQCGIDYKTITLRTMIAFRELYLEPAEEIGE